MATAVADSIPLLTSSDNHNGTLDDEFISGLVQGGSWSFGGGPRTLAYSFDLNFGGEPAQWSAAWKTAVNRAFNTWERFADLDFTRTGTPGGQLQSESTADIAIALEPNGGNIVGVGIFPDPEFADSYVAHLQFQPDPYLRPEGDISFDSLSIAASSLEPGETGFYVVLHEIGHALGLKHVSDGGGNDRPAFEDLGIGDYASRTWTVMQGGTVPSGHIPATPGVLDILAIQHIYGANMSYRTGDDTYAVGNGSYRAIWDAGGLDTLSASSWSQFDGALIDLREGAFSGGLGMAKRTAIAYDVTIENATGSSRADRLIGNDAGNRLRGGAGADKLDGGGGDDTLSGGEGADRLLGKAGDDVLIWGSTDTLISGGGGVDTLRVDTGGVILDLTVVPDAIRGIERIRLTGSSASTLTLNVQDVLEISTSARLKVLGDGDDTVDIGPGWNPGADVMIGAYTFQRYTKSGAVLLIDEDVAVV